MQAHPVAVRVFGLALTQTWPFMKAAAACLLILLTTTVVAVTAAFFLLYSSVARKHFWKATRLSFCNGDYWRHALLFAKWESKVERPFFIQPLKAPPPIDNMMVVVRNQI